MSSVLAARLEFLYYACHAGGMGRPATGQTPVRTVRIGEVWDEAKTNAEADGQTMTELVDRLLRRYNAAAARRRAQGDAAPE